MVLAAAVHLLIALLAVAVVVFAVLFSVQRWENRILHRRLLALEELLYGAPGQRQESTMRRLHNVEALVVLLMVGRVRRR